MLNRLRCWLGYHDWGETQDRFTHQTGGGRAHYGISRQVCSRGGCNGARWRHYWRVTPMYLKNYDSWVDGRRGDVEEPNG